MIHKYYRVVKVKYQPIKKFNFNNLNQHKILKTKIHKQKKICKQEFRNLAQNKFLILNKQTNNNYKTYPHQKFCLIQNLKTHLLKK